MSRWFKIVVGPLPASVILLPVLMAGGIGVLLAVLSHLLALGHMCGESWRAIAQLAVILVWIAVLASSPVALRHGPMRWWLVAGFVAGLISATRWLSVMVAQRVHDTATWSVWIAMLLGPMVQSLYYLTVLLRR